MGKYVSCGEFNKHIKYILFSVFFSCLSTTLFGYGYCNESHSLNIAQVYPDETGITQVSLSKHIIIHNIYRNFILLIVSIILYNYELYSTKSSRIEEEVKNIGVELIYENTEKKMEKDSLLYIIIIFILFNFHDILTIFYFTFDLSYLDLFILELPLFSYFNYKLLNNKIYSHHKCSLFLSISVCLTTKILSLFVYAFSDDFKDLIYNKHRFLYFVGIISYLVIIILRSYCVTVIKIFLDVRYISQNKLLIIHGFIVIIINLIIMFISSYNKCTTIDNIDIHLCNVVEDISNRNETYFENYFFYYKTLNDSENVGRYYEIIIEVFNTLIGSLAHCGYIYFYFLVIKYLTTFHIIFQSFTYSFAVRVLQIIVSIFTSSYSNQYSFNVLTFIIGLISDSCAALCIFIYLEIIELNFCTFNYNLRRNIRDRSKLDLEINKIDYSTNKSNNEGGSISEDSNSENNNSLELFRL